MDKQALGERIWALRVSLVRLAQSIVPREQDAEDAVSAAIVKAYQRADSLRSEDSLKPWLMKITVRCCYDLLRKKSRERLSADPAVFDQPVFTSQDSLYGLIQDLPPHLRQTVILRYYDNLSVGEIATVLGIARPSASRRLKQGRERLKDMILAEGGLEE